jgi:hypothetical protein
MFLFVTHLCLQPEDVHQDGVGDIGGDEVWAAEDQVSEAQCGLEEAMEAIRSHVLRSRAMDMVSQYLYSQHVQPCCSLSMSRNECMQEWTAMPVVMIYNLED